jgi:MFS family permease
VPLTHSLWPLIATQVVAGFGRGVCNPTLMSLSIRSLPSHERASGMGIYQAIYSIGMFFGPPLSGAIADQAGLSSVFVLTAVLCAGAALWGLFARALKPATAT